ncbi:hypothetical protein G9A89_021723 [Geosiphon pyriformis]|nr:hypothetical protein G9A89_021723 [Geosiphon pyriformis]
MFEEKISSNNGNERRSNSLPSPPKGLVTDLNTLDILYRMARHANRAYCLSENIIGMDIPGVIAHFHESKRLKEFVAYFGQKRQMTMANWSKRKPSLIPYNSVEGAFVDKKWLDTSTKLASKLQLAVIRFFVDMPGDKLKIYFVGHGIGGAYAILTGLLVSKSFEYYYGYQDEKPNIKWIAVTFGQPRIGNSQFAQHVNKVLETYRVTHKNDHVPHQPKFNPTSHTLMHHELEFWIESCDCQVYACPGFWNDDVFKAGESKVCNGVTDGEGETAHMGPYLETTFRDCTQFSTSLN